MHSIKRFFVRTYSDEVARRRFVENLQIYLVAVVWLIAFGLMFALGGCADREQPKSLDPNRSMEIKEPTSIKGSGTIRMNRLTILPGGRLITGGENLRIEADQLFSDDGVIESFAEGTRAAAGATGRNGGDIFVKVKSGKGVLHIFGRGENGGVGGDGVPGLPGKTGKPGKIAIATHEKVDVVCGCGNIAHDLKRRIRDGLVFDVILAQQEFFMRRFQHHCISEPGDGQPGEQGGHGSVGGNGGRGGNSPRIFVEVEDASALQIKAYPLPGQGGTGGSGGLGGDGGRGGAPGDHNLDYFDVCRSAAPGPNGPPGNKGQPGNAGLSGNTLPMCIKLGSTTFGDCEKFNSQGGN